MNRAEQARDFLELLTSLGYSAALVGGLAFSARVRSRFTRDLDFAVAVQSDADAEQLARRLQEHRFRLHTVIEQESAGTLATLRFLDPSGDIEEPSVDVLCGSCGIESEIVAAASPAELSPGIELPIAQVHHLIAMKTLSVADHRLNDASDLNALIAQSSEAQLDLAREALALIQARGFHRGKQLLAELDQFVQRWRRTQGPRV